MSIDEIVKLNQCRDGAEADPFTIDRYGQMVRHLPDPCASILDVGCCTGRGGAVLKAARPEAEITGMDLVESRIGILDRSAYTRGIVGPMHEIPLPDKSIDAVIAAEVIEHIPPALVDASLCEAFRVLKLKGKLILTTPNPTSLRFWWKGWSVLLEESHLSQHFPRSLRSRLSMTGFRKIRTFGAGRTAKKIGNFWPLRCYGSYISTGVKW